MKGQPLGGHWRCSGVKKQPLGAQAAPYGAVPLPSTVSWKTPVLPTLVSLEAAAVPFPPRSEGG